MRASGQGVAAKRGGGVLVSQGAVQGDVLPSVRSQVTAIVVATEGREYRPLVDGDGDVGVAGTALHVCVLSAAEKRVDVDVVAVDRDTGI